MRGREEMGHFFLLFLHQCHCFFRSSTDHDVPVSFSDFPLKQQKIETQCTAARQRGTITRSEITKSVMVIARIPLNDLLPTLPPHTQVLPALLLLRIPIIDSLNIRTNVNECYFLSYLLMIE
jgi:hypothetical protein